MSEISDLIIKRGVVKGKLTRFSTFLKENPTSSQIQTRLNKIKLLLDQFDEIQLQIELLDKETNYTLDRETFENEYFTIIALAEEIMSVDEKAIRELYSDGNGQKESPLSSPATSARSNSKASEPTNNSPPISPVPNTKSSIQKTANVQTNVKLPQINLVTFDGTCSQWLYFKDSFNALINNNPNISEIEKFHYLF